jgi:hypothetical protein
MCSVVLYLWTSLSGPVTSLLTGKRYSDIIRFLQSIGKSMGIEERCLGVVLIGGREVCQQK